MADQRPQGRRPAANGFDIGPVSGYRRSHDAPSPFQRLQAIWPSFLRRNGEGSCFRNRAWAPPIRRMSILCRPAAPFRNRGKPSSCAVSSTDRLASRCGERRPIIVWRRFRKHDRMARPRIAALHGPIHPAPIQAFTARQTGVRLPPLPFPDLIYPLCRVIGIGRIRFRLTACQCRSGERPIREHRARVAGSDDMTGDAITMGAISAGAVGNRRSEMPRSKTGDHPTLLRPGFRKNFRCPKQYRDRRPASRLWERDRRAFGAQPPKAQPRGWHSCGSWPAPFARPAGRLPWRWSAA